MDQYGALNKSELECPACGSGLVMMEGQRPAPGEQDLIEQEGGGLIGRLKYRLKNRGRVSSHAVAVCNKCGHQETAGAFEP